MRFQAVHDFASHPQPVMQIMVDPDFQLALQLPDVGQPEVLGREQGGSRTTLRLRYTYVGRLDPIAQRIIGKEALSWNQDVEVDYAAMNGRLVYVSDDAGRRLHGAADITFTALEGGTSRRIDGELVIAIPLLRSVAERSVVGGFRSRLDLEAEAIRARLPSGR